MESDSLMDSNESWSTPVSNRMGILSGVLMFPTDGFAPLRVQVRRREPWSNVASLQYESWSCSSGSMIGVGSWGVGGIRPQSQPTANQAESEMLVSFVLVGWGSRAWTDMKPPARNRGVWKLRNLACSPRGWEGQLFLVPGSVHVFHDPLER